MSDDILREYFRLALQEAGRKSLNELHLPSVWYHGSPFCYMKSMSDFRGPIMFLTDSKRAAKECIRVLPAAGKKPDGDVEDKSTIYRVKLLFGKDQIFDTRNDEHLQLFFKHAKQSQIDDPEMGFRKSDISRVHPGPGSRISGGEFPTYGIVRNLIPRLSKEGFVACYNTEGTQGTSLAVWEPQQNLELVGLESLNEAWWEETYEDSTPENLMLNEPGTIVEPDVRKYISKYLVQMGLMKSAKGTNPKGPKRKTRKA